VRYEDFIADNGRLVVNVVGEIPGQDPSKTYLLTAHFDSIASDTGDQTLAPGALDNATGIATLLEIARLLGALDPPHPVHVVFLNVEEVGLQGATVFADRASREERTYVAGINVDSVGAAALPSNQLYVNALRDAIFIQDILVSLASVNTGLGIDLIPTQNKAIKSDESRLQDAGIPTVLIASVLFGDPLINHSKDSIAQVDSFRVLRITQIVILTLGTMLLNSVG
jgi:Zn-dependent M28 family amino/carboxypeptidase